jgi:hypothetical protein
MSDPVVKDFSSIGLLHMPERANAYRSGDRLWKIYERWFTSNSDVWETNLPARGTTMATSVAAGQFNPRLESAAAIPQGQGKQCLVRMLFKQPVPINESIATLQVSPATASVTIYTAAAAQVIEAVNVKAADNGTTGSATVQVTRTRGVTTVNVLSSAVTVANADTNGTWYAGTINTSNDDLAAADVVKVEITRNSSWDGANLLIDVRIRKA